MSLDRLISLAQQTGDRLIVHDPVGGKDVVILDVDSYEHLMFGRKNVHKLSDSQVLDQINRDISVWRAGRDMGEFGERTAAMEEELSDHPLADPFEEDFAHSSDWHHAGSVIEDAYRPWVEEMDGEDEKIERFEDSKIGERNDSDDSAKLRNYEILENQAFGKPIEQHKEEESFRGPAEPLPGDEPVFYEEPV